MSLCEASGFEPNVAIYLDQLTTSYNTSQNGMGIAFVTDTIVNFTGTNNNVVFYKLDGDICTRPLCIAHKKKPIHQQRHGKIHSYRQRKIELSVIAHVPVNFVPALRE